jgi:hypothetical protein
MSRPTRNTTISCMYFFTTFLLLLLLSFVSQNLPIYPNLFIAIWVNYIIAEAFYLTIIVCDSIRMLKFKQTATRVAFSLKNRLCRFLVDDLNCHVFYF